MFIFFAETKISAETTSFLYSVFLILVDSIARPAMFSKTINEGHRSSMIIHQGALNSIIQFKFPEMNQKYKNMARYLPSERFQNYVYEYNIHSSSMINIE